MLSPLLAQPEEPLVRVPVRLVIAPTSVTDKQGKFINGLTVSDFTLFDNDVPQQIHEDADFLPISLAVAIETNLTVEGILPRIRELGPLLGTLVVGDGGECSIMTFDKHINVVQNFTSDLGRAWREYLLPVYKQVGLMERLIPDPSIDPLSVDVDYLVDHVWIVGSPDTVVEKLEASQEANGGYGTTLVFAHDFMDDPAPWNQSMMLLTKEVGPRVAVPA